MNLVNPVYISYVAKARLFTAVCSQLSIFTADCLHHPIQMAGVETIIMGVAHSFCYKLLLLLISSILPLAGEIEFENHTNVACGGVHTSLFFSPPSPSLCSCCVRHTWLHIPYGWCVSIFCEQPSTPRQMPQRKYSGTVGVCFVHLASL